MTGTTHWNIVYMKNAIQQLKRLDRKVQSAILSYMDEIAAFENPCIRGKALTGDHAGLWRYRVMDYRVVCRILRRDLVITVVKLGHRSQIYRLGPKK